MSKIHTLAPGASGIDICRMKYSPMMSQMLSAPPYLFAFAVVLLASSLSDRYNSRAFCLFAVAVMGATGYATIALAGWLQASSGWRYFGTFLAAAGEKASIAVLLTWVVNNEKTRSGRSAAVVLLNMCGQAGPILGVHLYPSSDGPFFVRGMSICAFFMLCVGLLSLILRLVLKRANDGGPKSISYEMVPQSETRSGLGSPLALGDDVGSGKSFKYML